MTELNPNNLPRPPGITQSTAETVVTTGNTIATPESASALHATEHEESCQQPTCTNSALKTSIVIPESVDSSQPAETAVSQDEPAPPPLSSIGLFLSKMCTILLVRCDFEQIKNTVELQTTQNKTELMASDRKPEEDTCNNASKNIAGTSGQNNEPNQIEICTSTRKRTIIDYKEYADKPPSPPKKKREVDLKWKPSKSRMAAEKYSRSKFFTKPTHLPRPVCR